MDARFLRQLVQEAVEVSVVGVPVLHRFRLLRQLGEDTFELVRRLAVLVRDEPPASGCCRADGARNGGAKGASGKTRQSQLTKRGPCALYRDRRRRSNIGAGPDGGGFKVLKRTFAERPSFEGLSGRPQRRVSSNL